LYVFCFLLLSTRYVYLASLEQVWQAGRQALPLPQLEFRCHCC
jgi:hypothetical protein